MNSIVVATKRARKLLSAELARTDNADVVDLIRVARVASRCAEVFEEACWVARTMASPPGAEVCSHALRHWLDAQLAACDALARAGGTGNSGHLRTALGLLRDGNAYAHQFNNARRFFIERLAA